MGYREFLIKIENEQQEKKFFKEVSSFSKHNPDYELAVLGTLVAKKDFEYELEFFGEPSGTVHRLKTGDKYAILGGDKLGVSTFTNEETDFEFSPSLEKYLKGILTEDNFFPALKKENDFFVYDLAHSKERRTYKAINFDLNTTLMANYFSPYTKGYAKLKSSFKKYGFIHRQGSGYVSQKPLTSFDVAHKVHKIAKENTWLSTCVKKFDVTNIEKQYSLLSLIKGSTPVHKPSSLTPVKSNDDGLGNDHVR